VKRAVCALVFLGVLAGSPARANEDGNKALEVLTALTNIVMAQQKAIDSLRADISEMARAHALSTKADIIVTEEVQQHRSRLDAIEKCGCRGTGHRATVESSQIEAVLRSEP
jgi:hypothetical protein